MQGQGRGWHQGLRLAFSLQKVRAAAGAAPWLTGPCTCHTPAAVCKPPILTLGFTVSQVVPTGLGGAHFLS